MADFDDQVGGTGGIPTFDANLTDSRSPLRNGGVGAGATDGIGVLSF